jgi:hypothetical protein
MYRGTLIQQLLKMVERAEKAAKSSHVEAACSGEPEVAESNGLQSEEALRGRTTPVGVSSEPG